MLEASQTVRRGGTLPLPPGAARAATSGSRLGPIGPDVTWAIAGGQARPNNPRADPNLRGLHVAGVADVLQQLLRNALGGQATPGRMTLINRGSIGAASAPLCKQTA